MGEAGNQEEKEGAVKYGGVVAAGRRRRPSALRPGAAAVAPHEKEMGAEDRANTEDVDEQLGDADEDEPGRHWPEAGHDEKPGRLPVSAAKPSHLAITWASVMAAPLRTSLRMSDRRGGAE